MTRRLCTGEWPPGVMPVTHAYFGKSPAIRVCPFVGDACDGRGEALPSSLQHMLGEYPGPRLRNWFNRWHAYLPVCSSGVWPSAISSRAGFTWYDCYRLVTVTDRFGGVSGLHLRNQWIESNPEFHFGAGVPCSATPYQTVWKKDRIILGLLWCQTHIYLRWPQPDTRRPLYVGGSQGRLPYNCRIRLYMTWRALLSSRPLCQSVTHILNLWHYLCSEPGSRGDCFMLGDPDFGWRTERGPAR